MKIKHYIYIFLVAFPISTFAENSVQINSIIKARLSLCHDVASYKIHKNIAIENLKQEQVVLAKAAQSAKKYTLEPNSVLSFTQAMMDSCKQIQHADFNNPKTQSHKIIPITETRKKLAKLNQKLFTTLAHQLNTQAKLTGLNYPSFSRAFSELQLSNKQQQTLFKALKKIELDKDNKK
ncbi:chorismate mutase [Parashewanella curva]|nr:chorismate mutase [Parashewanella curva]